MSDDRKRAILDALDRFARQRAGLEFCNYGDFASYRSEQRSITKDLHNFRELIAYVGRSGITADALLEAARHAFSGRLVLKELPCAEGKEHSGCACTPAFSVDYCTGQYFPTEYRKAACAVLASAIWNYWREHCMPSPDSWRVESWSRLGADRERSKPLQIHEACALLVEKGGQDYGHVQEYRNGKTPGDWLRWNARREFSRGVANGYFN